MAINNTKYRLEQVEIRVDRLSEIIDKLRTNDLPHMEENLSQMKTRINVLSAVNVGAIITALIISKVFT
jgi:hypothetical protein